MDPFEQPLTQALRAQVAAGCPGVILEVKACESGFNYSAAEGLFARDTARQIDVTDAFRIASVTKAVTAAAVLRLASQGHWDLDDPVVDLLPDDVIGRLLELKHLNSERQLTLRNLLAHRSGVPDYFFDPCFQARVAGAPDRLWHPAELVEAATKSGSLLFAPDSDFSYGDTAYVLIGIAIERLMGCSLADAYRSLIFDPLAMTSTYLEGREASRVGEIAHHYDGNVDLTSRNLSFDWAGGGLVSTASDLGRFVGGLFGGVLFAPRWIDEMSRCRRDVGWRPHSSARYIGYGLGLGTNIAYGEEIVGVTGVWGAFAYYWPSGDTTITGTLNLVGADRSALMDTVVKVLTQLK